MESIGESFIDSERRFELFRAYIKNKFERTFEHNSQQYMRSILLTEPVDLLDILSLRAIVDLPELLKPSSNSWIFV